MAKQKTAPLRKPEAKPIQEQKKSSFSLTAFATWTHLIIITVLFWYVYSLIFDHKPDMNGDNFAYYLLGKRFVQGLGFTNATSVALTPHTHFMPGYPYIMSIIMRIFGDEQDTLSFANGVMMYGTLLIMYFWVRRLTGSAALAFVTAFLLSLNAIMLRFSTITMSELPFVFFCVLGAFLFTHAISRDRRLPVTWVYFVLALLAMGASFYIRTTAIAFPLAVGLYLLIARDWQRLAAAVFGFSAMIIPWILRGMKYGSSYAGQLMSVNPYKPELGKITTSTMIERILKNIVSYTSIDIPVGVFASDASFEKAPFSYWLLGISIIALVAYGIYKLRDFRMFLLTYLGVTMIILLIWPNEFANPRFAVPLVPFVVMLALFGLKELIALVIGQGNSRFLPYAFLILSLAYITPIANLEAQTLEPMPPNYVNYFELARWVRKNTPKETRISARKQDMFMYYADRLCIGEMPSPSDTAIINYFDRNGVDYVVIDQLGFASTGRYLVPAVQKHPERFSVAYQLPNPDTYLMKFNKDPSKALQ